MEVGKLRHKVTVMKPIRFRLPDDEDIGDTQIAYFEVEQSEQYFIDRDITPFKNAFTMYCEIEPLQGRELVKAKEINADISHRIKMRYSKDVLSDCRIKWCNLIFEIGPTINTDLKNVEMSVYAMQREQVLDSN